MTALFKFTMTVAMAVALVRILLTKEDPGGRSSRPRASDSVADTNTVSGGNAAQEQRGPQPQDWRGAQNVLE